MLRIPHAEPSAVFAARGWLSEHPATFRALMIRNGVVVEAQAGTCVFRQDDDSDGVFGIINGAISVEGGHRRQSPLMGHVMRAGEWFGLKAVVHGGPRELTYRTLEPTRLLCVSRTRLVPLMQADTDIAIRVGQLGEIGSRLGTWIARDLLTPDAGRRLASVLFRVLGAGEVIPDNPEGFSLTHRGGLVDLNRFRAFSKWFSASVTPPPLRASAC